MDLSAFAAEVGPPDAGPVTCVGGRTQWDVGGAVDRDAREVKAPTGVVAFEPAEMTVRCGAGTTVAELDAALGEHGQHVALPSWPQRPGAETTDGATVGGVLAVGQSGVRRLGYGPMRDVLLEVRYVSADGTVIKGGGPVVKNVSGFDLCRVLVGSLGTLGFIGEVVLRCRPRPAMSQWYSVVADPFELRRRLLRAMSILWDGTTTWVLLEGHPSDVEAEAALLGADAVAVDDHPPLPAGGRLSLRPSQLRELTGTFVAEVGVGIVHVPEPASRQSVAPDAAELHHRVKTAFDPTGRMNPGRAVA